MPLRCNIAIGKDKTCQEEAIGEIHSIKPKKFTGFSICEFHFNQLFT